MYKTEALLGLFLIVVVCALCSDETYESFTNKYDAFCKSNVGNSTKLNMNCNKLTSDNCKSTGCCVWTSDNMCVAGGSSGPTFNTSNGKTKHLDYYYNNNECYGRKCVSE